MNDSKSSIREKQILTVLNLPKLKVIRNKYPPFSSASLRENGHITMARRIIGRNDVKIIVVGKLGQALDKLSPIPGPQGQVLWGDSTGKDFHFRSGSKRHDR